MKTASPELITLLAGSRQFVMWETFTFTLPGGTEIVYSTLDPDAPPAQGVPVDTGPVELPGENCAIATAQLVPALPVTIDGSLGAQDINDFYAVVLAPGNLLFATLTPPADADFDLFLFDAQGVQRAASTAGTGVSDDIEFIHSGSEAVTVYLNVRLFSGGGPYTLALSDLLPPPPPPPSGDTWLTDTFTGAEDTLLSAHVGEVGATWTDGHGGYSVGASGFFLNGGGLVRNPASAPGQVRTTGLPPAGLSDYFLELTCTLGEGSSINFFCVLLDGFAGCYAELAAYSSTVKLSTYASSAGQTVSNTWNTGAAYGAGIENNARMEVTNGRKTVTFKFDGQVITVSNLAAPLPQPDATEFLLYGPDGVTAVSSIHGGLL